RGHSTRWVDRRTWLCFHAGEPPMRLNRRCLVACGIAAAAFSGDQAIAQAHGSPTKSSSHASVTIDKPKLRTETGGRCRILADGTVSGSWGPSGLPTLAFTI